MQSTRNTPEQWKPVPTYEGTYEASTWGRVRSVPRVVPDKKLGQKRIKGFIMKQTDSGDGRMVINLRRGYKSNTMKVHRVIMLTFVGPRPEGMEICHNDGDYRNNRLDNLRYDTSSSNSYDMVEHGVHYWSKRDSCSRGHLFKGNNLIISLDKEGIFKQRICKSCKETRAYLQKRKHLKSKFEEIADWKYQRIMKGETCQNPQILALLNG